jgi:hypothetical protein
MQEMRLYQEVSYSSILLGIDYDYEEYEKKRMAEKQTKMDQQAQFP